METRSGEEKAVSALARMIAWELWSQRQLCRRVSSWPGVLLGMAPENYSHSSGGAVAGKRGSLTLLHQSRCCHMGWLRFGHALLHRRGLLGLLPAHPQTLDSLAAPADPCGCPCLTSTVAAWAPWMSTRHLVRVGQQCCCPLKLLYCCQPLGHQCHPS